MNNAVESLINTIPIDISIYIRRCVDQYGFTIFIVTDDDGNGNYNYEGRGYSLSIALEDYKNDLENYENKEKYKNRNRSLEEVEKERSMHLKGVLC